MTTLIETLANWCAAPALQRTGAAACRRGDHRHPCLPWPGGRISPPARSVTHGGISPQTRPWSALINATAAHAIDYDDNFAPGMSHASAVLLPALLPIALAQGSSSALIEAYLVGLQAFIGEAIGYGHYTAGWHGTSTVGCVGSAAGVAALMGLDAGAIARTLSIAVSMASGVKGQFGTP